MGTSPAIWIGGSASSSNNFGYQQLLTEGTEPTTLGGATVLRLWSGWIATASSAELDAIAAYCKANNVVVSVEDNFTTNWTQSWVNAASAAGLPVAYVDGGENLLNVPDTPAALNALAAEYVVDTKVIAAAFPNVQLGDTEPPITTPADQSAWTQELQNWWAAYDAAAAAAGVPGFSYFAADVAWDTSTTSWEAGLQAVSDAAHAAGLQLAVFINGSVNDTSDAEWVAQAEQHLADLAADTSIDVNYAIIETWTGFPQTVGSVSEQGSVVNLAAVTDYLFPDYADGLITSNGSVSVAGPAEGLVAPGLHTSDGSFVIAPLDVGTAVVGSLGVIVAIDQGQLNATVEGDGTVSGVGTNVLVLTGDLSDINAELATLSVSAPTALGPEDLSIEVFGAAGELASVTQDLVVADSLTGSTTLSFSGQAGDNWTSASVVTQNSIVTSEAINWGSPDGSSAATDQPTPIFTTLDPLAEGDLLPSGVNAAAQGNTFYDPTDSSEMVDQSILSTTRTYDPTTGQPWTEVDVLAPDSSIGNASPVIVTTQYNTGDNPAWQAEWGATLASFAVITDAAGQTVETTSIYQPGAAVAETQDIFDPSNGQLWQQVTLLPGQAENVTGDEIVTEYNTGDNPNWDETDWGNAVEVTLTFTDGIGVDQTQTFSDGSVVDNHYDLQGTYSWSVYSLYYNPSGQLTQANYQWAAGGYTAVTYSNSGDGSWISQSVYVDAENQVAESVTNWLSSNPIEQTIDFVNSSGALIAEIDFYRDGVTETTTWSTSGSSTSTSTSYSGPVSIAGPGQTPDSFSPIVFGPPTVTAQTPAQIWAGSSAILLTLPANTFIDPQDEVLSYTALLSNGQPLPSWLTFDPATDSFTGTAPSTAESLSITVVAIDTSGLSTSDSFSVTVIGQPSITAQTPAQTWTDGSAILLTLPAGTFTDPQGEALTYTAMLSNGQLLPSWLTFDPATETFTGTAPSTAQNLSITVVATDTSGLSTSESFSATVIGPPTLTAQTPAQTWTDGSVFRLALPASTFTDPQDEALTYTAMLANGQPLPTWLTFNPATDTFSGTAPSAAQTLSITVVATDTSGLSTSESFSATVIGPPTVNAPTPAQTWKEGSAISFALPGSTFTDPQDEALSYTATLASGKPLPSWLKFNGATDMFTGTAPKSAQSLKIKVVATDTSGLSVSETFTVNIDSLAMAKQTPNQTWQDGEAVSFTLSTNTFTDPGLKMTFAAYQTSGPSVQSWLSFNPTAHEFVGTVPTTATGTVGLEVIATDLLGVTAADMFSVKFTSGTSHVGAASSSSSHGTVVTTATSQPVTWLPLQS